MEQNLKNIVSQFAIEGKVNEILPLGNGLINDTYKVNTVGEETPDYVLQRINHSIFADVELLQHNIEVVTSHIHQKLSEAGEHDIDRKVLQFAKTPEGKTYCKDGGSYWRVSRFVAHARTFETVDPYYSHFAGLAFGKFEAMLTDVEETLGETIPDFHNMELRYRQLHEAIEANKAGRLEEVKDFIADLEKYVDEMYRAERLYREGKLPKRICHCDTKVNNMMFDEEGRVLCVIDLDTVMPSFVFSDYGDFLRTAANTVAEDCPDFDKIDFRMDIFEAFTSGYLESAGSFLTPIETENLPYAAALFPYMQSVRFLWDYLNGDVYWKTRYPTHNLVRAKNQWFLFQSVLAHTEEMKAFIVEQSKK